MLGADSMVSTSEELVWSGMELQMQDDSQMIPYCYINTKYFIKHMLVIATKGVRSCLGFN